MRNYVEPFFGSGAVLLGRHLDERAPSPIETVNDIDGFVVNFWRAIAADPASVAAHATWPVSELDLHARNKWLGARRVEMRTRLESDPDFSDARIAGWWVWGLATWIGSGWCDPASAHWRNIPRVGSSGQGVHSGAIDIATWFCALQRRMARVRVCSGGWRRILTPTVTAGLGVTAVFLDPPYSGPDRTSVYVEESFDVARDVAMWAREHGDDPLLRIAVCGYAGEHDFPHEWECMRWRAQGGMSKSGCRGENNAGRERIWFSPHCETPATQGHLWEFAGAATG